MKSGSQANKAYSEIRRKILSGQLAPKTRLKEDEWAAKLGVSRMAIREALNRLLGEDLLTTGEKGGYYMKPMSSEDVHQIRELREIIEVGAIRMAHNKLTPAQLTKLEKLCDDFSAMIEQQYYNGAWEVDLKFHETLVEFSGNIKLLKIYHLSHIPLFHHNLGRSRIGISDYAQTDREHRQIVKAIKKNNFAAAEKALIQHLARAEAAVIDMEYQS